MLISKYFKNARCMTRIHNKFLKTFSDRKIYINMSFRLPASLQSPAGS